MPAEQHSLMYAVPSTIALKSKRFEVKGKLFGIEIIFEGPAGQRQSVSLSLAPSCCLRGLRFCSLKSANFPFLSVKQFRQAAGQGGLHGQRGQRQEGECMRSKQWHPHHQGIGGQVSPAGLR